MKRLIASILLASITSTSLSYADPPAPSTADVGKVVAAVSQGQPAPFPGVLFSQAAAASVVTDLRSIDEKVKIEVDTAVKKAEAIKDAKYSDLEASSKTDRVTRDAQIDAQTKKIKELNDALKDAQNAAPSRPLWATVGFVGGIVVTVVTVFAITQATK